jgi:hypothetical protein
MKIKVERRPDDETRADACNCGSQSGGGGGGGNCSNCGGSNKCGVVATKVDPATDLSSPLA